MYVEAETVEHEICRLTNDSVKLLLLSYPGGKRWLVVGFAVGDTPLVDDPNKVIYALLKKRYTENKAKKLFVKVVDAFREGDLSALRKLCHHTGRNDDYICWAFDLITESEALKVKQQNELQASLHREFTTGRLSEEEYRRLRDEATDSFLRR